MEDGPIQPGQYLQDGGKGGKKEAEEAAKENQERLGQLRMSLEEANRYEVEGLQFDEDQLSVLKDITERLTNIDSMMLAGIRAESREIKTVDEEEPPPNGPTKDDIEKLEMPSNLKGTLAAIAGVVVGFVGQFTKIFKTIGNILKEDALAGPVIKFFQKIGNLFKSEGAIGKLI